MPRTIPLLEAVLDAATLVLERREDQMLTAVEWDALAAAVAACEDDEPPTREESFAMEDGLLVRRVTPLRGTPYEHRCPAAAFENVAWAIDDRNEPFTLDDLQAATKLPFTQVAVALAFIKERGCVAPVHGRKHRAASECVHLDANDRVPLPARGAAAMTTATPQDLLITLLEAGQSIAAEPDDPMHDAPAAAGDIDSASAEGNDGITITTTGGRTFHISIAESRWSFPKPLVPTRRAGGFLSRA